jgi:hypothetical protein
MNGFMVRGAVGMLMALLCAACGEGGGSSGTASATAVAQATATASPAAEPVAAPTVAPLIPVQLGLESIASNFDTSAWIVPAHNTGEIALSNSPDVVGAFRFICNASHLAYDDPIVYPGQPGKAHLHQFFGNTAANANSTYSSLRQSGESSCTNKLNRSAYWTPAMLDGKGGVVVPDYVAVYYKRFPVGSPYCTQMGTACVPLPRGLRYVFGFNMLNPSQVPTGAAYFDCDGATATPGNYPDIVTAAANCPAGNRLGAVIQAPNCWDGKNLDSADHRSHIAYASTGSWGYFRCPTTHPYVIPSFRMAVWYTVDDNLDRSGTWSDSASSWHLSSDEMNGMMMRPGSTLHADWFGAWDDSVMANWTGNCVEKLLSCVGGDMGNGQQMKMFSGFTWNAEPRVVPVPAKPAA